MYREILITIQNEAPDALPMIERMVVESLHQQFVEVLNKYQPIDHALVAGAFQTFFDAYVKSMPASEQAVSDMLRRSINIDIVKIPREQFEYMKQFMENKKQEEGDPECQDEQNLPNE